MRHGRIGIGSGLGIVALLVAACGGGTPRGTRALEPVVVRVAKAELAKVPSRVELVGTVEADRQAAVSSRVMATVTAVHVNAGDAVAAGQLLVEIDPQTARGQVAQAQGALAQAQAALALAERNFERFQALAGKGAASQLELDMARMQFEQAKGAVQQGEGAVESASSVARESRVVAPFAGRVVAKLVEVGDLAAPGRPLVTVESAAGRRLVVAVPESVMAGSLLRRGMSLGVAIDALPERHEIRGTVSEISPGADSASHSFTIKVSLGDQQVASGLVGRVWLPLGERAVVSVPGDAVLTVGGMTVVALRDGGGKARTRAVSLGAPLPGGRVEVLAGLAGDEDVLVGLSSAPADGAPVEEAGS